MKKKIISGSAVSIRAITGCVLLLVGTQAGAQTIRYVSPGGGNISPYTNWAMAATDPQTAINACAAGDEVRVDSGVYAPAATVAVSNAVTVIGVNGAGATVIDGRDAIRCLRVASTGSVARGFTIKNGTTFPYGNSGGGGVVLAGGAIMDCVVISNKGYYSAGVAINTGAVINCAVLRNVQSGYTASSGGGIGMESGLVTIRNCLVAGNHNLRGGAGVYAGGVGTVHIQNCTIAANHSDNGTYGAGLVTFMGDLRVTNSIVYGNEYNNFYDWGNATVAFGYTCITPAQAGAGNTVNNPVFIDQGSGFGSGWSGGDLRLERISPCINAGDNHDWMGGGALDLDGRPRVLEGTVDMGAYEHPPPGTVFILRGR